MNPDHVMTVKSKCEYMVRISSDGNQTNRISGICCLPSGQVIVTDEINRKVKLLDQHYNVCTHCDVSNNPSGICQITSTEVAVSLNSEVQFISVSNGKLVKGRKFKLPHDASCIAHHQGVLYVTGLNALYQYTLTGSLVKKLYEDNNYRVWKCAVNPAGDRIYVTTSEIFWAHLTLHGKDRLITLSTDGTLIIHFL
ncbi:uncharacterized protein LOC127851600 [Dreissena polymorpha]|uniref:Uncharacterized protein n=1 Tax=Dreissena polymorpha TaxID=45954 RepID=A0A9D4HUS3_DREPO|nr:uncharacterized protein LOC127851600 [Dreissena polymorpha]KAH3735910.1 hypothetical protein DPMN_042471 [Dreissena polymorpha]